MVHPIDESTAERIHRVCHETPSGQPARSSRGLLVGLLLLAFTILVIGVLVGLVAGGVFESYTDVMRNLSAP